MIKSIDERCLDLYNESFRDEAEHVLNALDKIPAAAWTDQDHDQFIWAINMLSTL